MVCLGEDCVNNSVNTGALPIKGIKRPPGLSHSKLSRYILHSRIACIIGRAEELWRDPCGLLNSAGSGAELLANLSRREPGQIGMVPGVVADDIPALREL